MPIRPYLDGHKFDDETVRLMGLAFEIALGSFGGTPAHDDPIRAALAQTIIAKAEAGERDPERLCEAALNAITPPDPVPKSRTIDWILIDDVTESTCKTIASISTDRLPGWREAPKFRNRYTSAFGHLSPWWSG